jgi:hypothetical protein
MNKIHFFIKIKKSNPKDIYCNRVSWIDSSGPEQRIQELNVWHPRYLYISIPRSCVKKAYAENIFKLMCAGKNGQEWPLPLQYVMDSDGNITLL